MLLTGHAFLYSLIPFRAMCARQLLTHVREGTARCFAELVPTMEVDIYCEDPTNMENYGAKFRVRSSSSDADGGGAEWRYSLEELSGGQRTLLNLSLLLALARQRVPLVLLMDEVDAALDENNASKVAFMLKELSSSCQIIAISHRSEFHRAADHIVNLHKEKGYTVVSQI